MSNRKTEYERVRIETLLLTADTVRTSGYGEYEQDNDKDNFFKTLGAETLGVETFD